MNGKSFTVVMTALFRLYSKSATLNHTQLLTLPNHGFHFSQVGPAVRLAYSSHINTDHNRLISVCLSSCMSDHNSGTDGFALNLDRETLQNPGMFAWSFPCKSQLTQLRILKEVKNYLIRIWDKGVQGFMSFNRT